MRKKRLAPSGITCFEFRNLAGKSGIRHGVFSRHGGSGATPFNSLNVALSVGDLPDIVKKNRLAVRRVMGNDDLVFIHQVHGRRVILYDEITRDNTEANKGVCPEGDAVITNTPGVNLVIQTADCQSILLFDPVNRAIGNIHSGWRGSIQNIIGHTVNKMRAAFGSLARNIMAGIGPSLGPCCAEFIHYKKEIPKALWQYKHDKNKFDFWAISRDQLQSAGLQEKNIEQSHLCTRCRTDLFFSYRAEKTTGRFASVIGLMR